MMHPNDSMIEFDSPNLTPLKQNNIQYTPSQDQILSYAIQVLQLNPSQDLDLVYLAEEALKAALPQNWQACEYQSGSSQNQGLNVIIYRNKLTKQVIFDHPLDSFYKEKVRQLKMMRNTAKYSQNITPINQQMLQSSVILFNKNNSKGIRQSFSAGNNSSSGIINAKSNESKSQQFQSPKNRAYLNNQLLARNITQESLLYEEGQEFQNLSLITDTQFQDNESEINNAQSKKINSQKPGKLQDFKQKNKTIKAIIVPNNNKNQHQIMKKRIEKQSMHQQKVKIKKEQNNQYSKTKIINTVLQSLYQIQNTNMNRIKKSIKSELKLSKMEQNMIILQQFGSQKSQIDNNLLKNIKQKQKKLKQLEIDNKLYDQKIKDLMMQIQLQKNV